MEHAAGVVGDRSSLGDALAGWAPEPTEHTDRVGAWAVGAFSALLDLPTAAAVDGDPVPPLWHWFAFLDHPRHSELDADGHAGSGRFMPPIPDRRRMFAGGRLRVDAPMLVGEEITRRSALARVEVKSGRSGEMAFVTVRHEFRRGTDLLVTEEQDLVYRSQPAGAARPVAAPEPRPEPEHEWRLETPTGPELLFCFSALTYNTHRIHYDQPYVTGVEGYPGLVVHGPLLALLLLEIPRRHLRGIPLRGFDFRLTRPAFAGAPVVTVGRADGVRLALSGGTAGGAASITGSAVLHA